MDSRGQVASGPLLVIAKYKFEGHNNDELSFAKNDVIMVTQQLEGGWWEGSLDGRVGWFPSEFVGIIKNNNINNSKTEKRDGMPENGERRERTAKSKNTVDAADQKTNANRSAFRAQLVQELLTKEQEHSNVIEQTVNVLMMLENEQTELNNDEMLKKAITMLSEFVKFKQNLVINFEEEIKKPLEAQRIGKLLLDFAPALRSNLRPFCERYCDLVELLNRNSSDIEKHLTKLKMNLKDLILGLSLMFRHIQKYARVLQEIERNTQEGHPDRGNLQRVASFYRDFHGECETVRRQREAQLDFIQTGALEENIGKDFEQKLGTLLYTGKVTMIQHREQNKKLIEDDMESREFDRCIAVFSLSILLFEMQIPSGHYLLKNHFVNAELIIHIKESSRNTLKLFKGPELLATLKSIGKNDFNQLTDVLRQSVSQFVEINEESNVYVDKNIKSIEEVKLENIPSTVKLRPHLKNCLEPGSSQAVSASIGNIHLNHQLEMILPDGMTTLPQQRFSNNRIPAERLCHNGISSPTVSAINKPLYSGWALRPIPPQRSEWLPSSKDVNRTQQQIKLRKGLSPEEQEDAHLLKIIEGYCLFNNVALTGCVLNSTNIQCCGHHWQKPYQQRNSADSCTSPCGGGPVRRAASYPDHHDMANRPQVIVAEDEKLFVEEIEGDEVVVKERSLVDTVYALKDQLTALTKEVNTMRKTLEHEQRARRRMEECLKQDKNSSSVTTGTLE